MAETIIDNQHFCPVCGCPMILKIILAFDDEFYREETDTTNAVRKYEYWECMNIKCGHKVGE